MPNVNMAKSRPFYKTRLSVKEVDHLTKSTMTISTAQSRCIEPP